MQQDEIQKGAKISGQAIGANTHIAGLLLTVAEGRGRDGSSCCTYTARLPQLAVGGGAPAAGARRDWPGARASNGGPTTMTGLGRKRLVRDSRVAAARFRLALAVPGLHGSIVDIKTILASMTVL